MRYNTPNSPMDNVRDFVTRGGIPVTMVILLVSLATFLGGFFFSSVIGTFLETYIVFSVGNLSHAPWTLLSYPLATSGFIALLWQGFMFWSYGGSLERSWGSGRYVAFLAAVSVISALSIVLGTVVLRQGGFLLSGLLLPLAAVMVAFCMLNPEQTISFILCTVRAKYVAIIVTAYIWYCFGPTPGFFACGGLLAAYLYVRFGRTWGDIGSYSAPQRVNRGPDLRMDSRPARPAFRTTLDGSPQRRSPLDFAGRLKDWRERRRLEKLWRNSGLSGSEPGWQDDEKRRR